MSTDKRCDNFNIRLAARHDMEVIMKMIQKLADFENVPDGPKIKAEDLKRDAFDSTFPWLFVLVVESEDNGIVGYALCHRAYSSWLGRAMYLEDFYVEPHLRGLKLGHRLFKELCKMACDEGVNQIDWHVLIDNELAVEFYKKHGAYDICSIEGRTAYRIKKQAIENVANSLD